MRASSILALAIRRGPLGNRGWLACGGTRLRPLRTADPAIAADRERCSADVAKDRDGRTMASTTSSTAAINPNEITVIDGDTIRARGRTVRLVGFDAPESGSLARCDRERQIADRAAAHMRSLVAGGGLELRLVRCSCRPGTEGTSLCNYGRACGELRSHGRDVAGIMIGLSLARSYICGATACPLRGSWC